MARQLAITIGINHYEHERSLQCAENDAVEMGAYLQEIGFSEVQCYTSTAADASKIPKRNNLLRAITRISNQVRLSKDDSFWFFFSGHGGTQQGRDFLLPNDGEQEMLEDTAIETDRVFRALKRCGAGNLVFILDMCRNEIPGKSIGSQTAILARQRGVITLFSCSPGEQSYELPDIGRGAFTYALLEALRSDCVPSQCNALELSDYLSRRVPELAKQYGSQRPYVIAEPIEKGMQILLPLGARSDRQASIEPAIGVDQLIANAERAMRRQDFDQADELWRQIIRTATEADDRDLAVEKLLEITTLRQSQTRSQTADTIAINPDVAISKQTVPIPETFSRDDSTGYSPSSNELWDVDKVAETPEDLNSEREGINYTRLKELLSQGNWREADQETADRMCEVMGRQKEGWLRIEDIKNFPCKDLKIIDRLWIKASGGKFGFSMQKKIWQDCGSPSEDNNNWETFGNRVGWNVRRGWVDYSNLIFDTSAQDGHLPAWCFCIEFYCNNDRDAVFRFLTNADNGEEEICHILFSRVQACKV